MTDYALYRFYTENGRLLYVGKSINLGQRFTQHARSREWWIDITTIDIERFATHDELLAAEREAITAEGPVHNVQLNGSPVTS